MRRFRLATTALILLLSGCGGGRTGTPAGPSSPGAAPDTLPAASDSASPAPVSPTPTATVAPAAALAGADLVDSNSFRDPSGQISFRSPTQNIGCSLSGTTASCQLTRFTYTPRLPSTCRGVGVFGATIDLTEAPRFACATDTVAAGAKQLPYGQRLESGSIACVSRADGVTCLNHATGHGFRIAEGAYEFF